MNKFKSRKFWLGVMTPLVIIFSKVIGLELDDKAVLAVSGVVSAYIMGEAYVDSRKIKD